MNIFVIFDKILRKSHDESPHLNQTVDHAETVEHGNRSKNRNLIFWTKKKKDLRGKGDARLGTLARVIVFIMVSLKNFGYIIYRAKLTSNVIMMYEDKERKC